MDPVICQELSEGKLAQEVLQWDGWRRQALVDLQIKLNLPSVITERCWDEHPSQRKRERKK